MGLIYVPGGDDHYTTQKVMAMNFVEIATLLNNLQSEISKKDNEITYLKQIVDTSKSFAEEMMQMGQTILDFAHASAMSEGIDESIAYSQDF